MKQTLIGTFPLGHENVDLYAILDDSGGEFYFQPDEKSVSRIKVGLDYDHWEQVVSVLLHEAFEFAMTRFHHRYTHSGKINGDQANYLFMFDHSEFGDLCSRVATFMTPALPKLADAYKKQMAKRK